MRIFFENIFKRAFNPAGMPNYMNDKPNRHNVAGIFMKVMHKKSKVAISRNNMKIHLNAG